MLRLLGGGGGGDQGVQTGIQLGNENITVPIIGIVMREACGREIGRGSMPRYIDIVVAVQSDGVNSIATAPPQIGGGEQCAQTAVQFGYNDIILTTI